MKLIHAVRISLVALTLGISHLSSEILAKAQITFSVFTDPHPVVSGGTIGFAYAGNKFVGSVQGDGLRVLYATDLIGGNVRVFAPSVSIPPGSGASEHYVASSLGLGGFPSRDIYVAAGNDILHINNDGTESNLFVVGLASPVRGMLFDAVGTFNYDLLASTYGGQVYRIDSSGVATLLASVGEDMEGMDIVPLGAGFGSFDGQLVVVSEGSGLLRAISPSGAVQALNANAPIPYAERLSFVPLDLGASGSPIEGLYESSYAPNVLKYDANQFAQFKGDAIVTSELANLQISRVHWNGTSFTITIIGTSPRQAEDGIFVTPALINPLDNCRSMKNVMEVETDERCSPHCRDPRGRDPHHFRDMQRKR